MQRYVTLCLASFLGLSSVTLLSWFTTILPKLTSSDPNINPLEKSITEDESSLLASSLYLGATIGTIPFGLIVTRFGRKFALLCISTIHIISFLTLAFVASFPWYCVMLTCNGLAFGSTFAVLPVYLSEIAENSNRGMFTTVTHFSFEIGVLLPLCFGPFISFLLLNVILSCFSCFSFILVFFLVPESPYFLLQKNRREDAKRILGKLGTKMDSIEERITEMGKSEGVDSFSSLFRSRTFRKSIIISFILRIGQNLAGFTAIFPYSTEIFTQTGITSIPPDVCPFVLQIIGLLSAFASSFFIDRFGRRFLLFIGTLGTFVSNFAMGVFFYLKFYIQIDTTPIWWFPLLCLGLFIVFFNFGFNSVPHIITSEIFQTNIRPFASGSTSFINWTTAFLVTFLFLRMNHFWGVWGTFWFYSAASLLTFLFVGFYVPETKQKSFWEIQEMLAK